MFKIKSLIIVTGVSGAGKTAALNVLEDMEYLTMDNIPCNFATLILEGYMSEIKKSKVDKIAIGMDVRSFTAVEECHNFLDNMRKHLGDFEIIFLDSSNEVILNRYNLTRRRHPVVADTLLESIENERKIMNSIKERATRIIDTSFTSAKQLADKLKESYYFNYKDAEKINIHLQSFGYKYGMPIDLDLAFDVRFLPNPYYIPELREKTGNDIEVQNYVMDSQVSKEFYNKLINMLEFLIPNYIAEGKKHLSIGIGCSGGKHRSVTFVNNLSKDIKKMKNLKVYTSHKESEKGHW
ncbi:MAG: RNase adapter RapZ [Fusobacteriaceae bacterium]